MLVRIGPSVLVDESRVRTFLTYVTINGFLTYWFLTYVVINNWFQLVSHVRGDQQRILVVPLLLKLESFHGWITQKLLQRKTVDSQEIQDQLISAEAP